MHQSFLKDMKYLMPRNPVQAELLKLAMHLTYTIDA
jgi:hypothetical protein